MAKILIVEDKSTNMTGLVMTGDQARARAAGCDGGIVRSMSYREFLAMIAAQLERS